MTGTGAGTFGTAISVYQTAEPGYAIDQAHNHYLQLMAEGGAWLLLPAALAAGLFLLLASRSLKQDLSSNYLIRAGACAGIAGVLVQSIWETGSDDACERAAVRRACGHRDRTRRAARHARAASGERD